jgi:ABC-2 type transport system permease protein
MWSVCKKELRQFFSSLTGYIAIVVFLVVNGLMLFVFRDNIFDYGYATLDRFFGLAPWVLLLLIPAITMRSFSDEFKTGTFELLQTRPLTRWQIVTGKYLGSLIVVIIALLPTLVYFISIQRLSSDAGIDTGAAMGAYIGLFFLAAVFTAIGICSSSFTTNSVVAFIISLIACALIYYGFDAISKLPALENGMDYYVAMAGIDFHYKSISRGVVDTRDVIYFLSVIFLFLMITDRNLIKGKTKKAVNKIFASKLGWLVLLVLLLGVNFLAATFHSRLDLTQEKRYTLSKTTRSLVKGLNEQLEIDVFLKGEFPAGFRKLANSTREFLGLLKEANSSKLHFRFISPQDEVPGTQMLWGDSLQNMGALPINLTVQAKAGQSMNIIFPVAIMRYKGKQSMINLFPGASREISQTQINSAESMMEYQFTSTIDKLTAEKTPAIAYATGNGEPTDARVMDIEQTLSQDYFFKAFDITTGPIPQQADVLMIVKPTLKFTDDEKLRIDQFLMQGGRLLCFIDRLYDDDDSLARGKTEIIAYDRDLDLTDMFFRYGVRINTDLVMDLRSDFRPIVAGGTAENPQLEYLPWNYFPLLQPPANLRQSIGYVTARYVNSVDTIEVEGVKKTVLLASSPNSRTIGTPALISLNENKTVPQDEKFRQNAIPVAMMLEGSFTSFFNNRLGKAKLDSMSASGLPFIPSIKDGKMIVVGDGDMVFNEVDREAGPLPMGWNRYTFSERQRQTENGKYFIPAANREFLKNCIEYLVSDPSIGQIRNKEIVLRLLDSKKVREQRSMWQFINIGLPLLLVLLFGWIYQQLRKRRYTEPASAKQVIGNKQ